MAFYFRNWISVAKVSLSSGDVPVVPVLVYSIDLGYSETFYSFVIRHDTFELTAILFSGAAGLRPGYSILSPGNLSRVHSLRIAGIECIQMMYGVMLMLLIAAFTEVFWPPCFNIAGKVSMLPAVQLQHI